MKQRKVMSVMGMKRILAWITVAVLVVTGTAFGWTSSAEGILAEHDHAALLQEGAVPDQEVPEFDEIPRYGEAVTAETVLMQGLKRRDSSITLSSYKLTREQTRALVTKTINDYPELFYVSSGYSFYRSGDIVTRILPSYTMTQDESTRATLRYEAAIREITSGVDPAWTPVQKLLYLHDYLCLHYSYDHRDVRVYDAYNLFVQKMGVCQAYTLALEALVNAVDACEITWVSSDSMNHIWNAVKLDGHWYYVDATWDDPTITGQGDMPQRVDHDNFLLSEEMFRETTGHSGSDWVNGEDSMTCTDTKYDTYFWNTLTSTLIPDQNGWLYYMENGRTANRQYGSLCRYNLLTDTRETVLTLNTNWPTNSGGNYTKAYTTPARVGDWIYFNTASQVRGYNPTTQATKTVYTIPLNGYEIYSLRVLGDRLYYYLDEEPVRSTGVHKAVPLNGTLSYEEADVGETMTVTVTPDAGYTLKAGSLMAMGPDGEAVSVPERDGFRVSSGSDRYTFTVPENFASVSAVFVKANAAAPNIGLVGCSVNTEYVADKEKGAMRCVYRIAVTQENDRYYTVVGGVKKRVTAFGVLLGTDKTYIRLGGMTVDMQDDFLKNYNFAQMNVRYDVCDAYQDISVMAVGLQGHEDSDIYTRAYLTTVDGQTYYTEPVPRAYGQYIP